VALGSAGCEGLERVEKSGIGLSSLRRFAVVYMLRRCGSVAGMCGCSGNR